MINRMASDLGISRYANELKERYYSRVIYSAIACWTKVAALDETIKSEDGTIGVSRRHILDKSQSVLKYLIAMFPEVKEWFETSDDENPARIIRKRLIQHGDLLNVGFDTNLVLPIVHTKQVTNEIETIYGITLNNKAIYSGIATVLEKTVDGVRESDQDVQSWLSDFLKHASWSYDLPDKTILQYYNPKKQVKTNYEAWQDSLDYPYDGIVLARLAVVKNSYDYYLLKPKENMVHKIDDFVKEQGGHIRVMYALRAEANNRIVVEVKKYCDHIGIHLNANLPTEETSLLESYAWPEKCIDDKRGWIMSIPIWKFIKTSLMALDVRIMEVSNG